MGSVSRRLKRKGDRNAGARARQLLELQSELAEQGRELTPAGRENVIRRMMLRQESELVRQVMGESADRHLSRIVSAESELGGE